MAVNKQLNMQVTDRETILAPLQELNLMDDFMFDVATADFETFQIIIELSLGIRLKGLKWKEGQRVVHNLPGKRGIRMDFSAEDLDGNLFDVEMQKQNEGNIPKRTRFYQALQDAPILKSGEKGFDNLHPSVFVMICGFDLFGYGLYQYTFENTCAELPALSLGDGVRKIILNTRGTNDADVSKELISFLHYVEHSNQQPLPEDCSERLARLHKKIAEIKSSVEVGVSYMKMEERDRLIEEKGMQRGLKKGELLLLISQIHKKVVKGKPLSQIAEELEESPDAIQSMYDIIAANPQKEDEEIFNLLENAETSNTENL